MTDPIIRDATAEDMADVAALYDREAREGVATFESEGPSPEGMAARWRAVLDLGAPWLVAEIDGRFAGYAYATAWKPRAAYRHTAETTVYVAPQAHRRGVGRALMETLVTRLAARDIRRLMASITSEGDGSVALHTALGFRTLAVLPRMGWKAGRWLDVTLMQRDLAPDGGPPSGPGLDLG